MVAYGSGRLRALFVTKFKSQFKRGLRKVLVSRAGRLRDWSQGGGVACIAKGDDTLVISNFKSNTSFHDHVYVSYKHVLQDSSRQP